MPVSLVHAYSRSVPKHVRALPRARVCAPVAVAARLGSDRAARQNPRRYTTREPRARHHRRAHFRDLDGCPRATQHRRSSFDEVDEHPDHRTASARAPGRISGSCLDKAFTPPVRPARRSPGVPTVQRSLTSHPCKSRDLSVVRAQLVVIPAEASPRSPRARKTSAGPAGQIAAGLATKLTNARPRAHGLSASARVSSAGSRFRRATYVGMCLLFVRAGIVSMTADPSRSGCSFFRP